MTITAEYLHEMRTIQEPSGIRAVLIHLNGLTDHRFTALYRFDDDTLHLARNEERGERGARG
jgi:hypothetical protein